MKSTPFRALCALALSFAFFGAILSGCSGGGSSPVPSTLQNQEVPAATTPSGTDSENPAIQIGESELAAAPRVSSYKFHTLPVLQRLGATRSTPMSVIFPADLKYGGGHVLKTVVSHDIYLNDPSTEWGNPQAFLNNLNASTFIHVIDQYVGSATNARYKTGTNASVVKAYANHVVPLNDIFTFVHAAAGKLGSGYGNIYHVFIPAGLDTCTSAGFCYSPNNPATFFFCAYHASVTFADAVGHVLFSVEPYQNVVGCRTSDTLPPIGPQPPPNGQLTDSTNSTLSHEYFESITDPDPTSGWSNPNPSYPSEIGDLCRDNPYVIISLNGHSYELQREYSNAVHGCVD